MVKTMYIMVRVRVRTMVRESKSEEGKRGEEERGRV